MPFERSSGLLLHITSLPSFGGIGDFGPAAYAFADFLAASKQRLWQVLPLGPTGYGNSPYASLSAFAGNPLLISLENLAERRLDRPHAPRQPPRPQWQHRPRSGRRPKLPLIEEAARNFLHHHTPEEWTASKATAARTPPGSMTGPSTPSCAANLTTPPGVIGPTK